MARPTFNAAFALLSSAALGVSVFGSSASAADPHPDPSTTSGAAYECSPWLSPEGRFSCTITGDAEGRIDLRELVDSLAWAGVDADSPMVIRAVGGSGGGTGHPTGAGGIATTATTVNQLNDTFDNPDGIYDVYVGRAGGLGHGRSGTGGSSTILAVPTAHEMQLDHVVVLAGGGGGSGGKPEPSHVDVRGDPSGGAGGVAIAGQGEPCERAGHYTCGAGYVPGPPASDADAVGGYGGGADGRQPMTFQNPNQAGFPDGGDGGDGRYDQSGRCLFTRDVLTARSGGGGGGYPGGFGGEADTYCKDLEGVGDWIRINGGSGGGSAAIAPTIEYPFSPLGGSGRDGSLTLEFAAYADPTPFVLTPTDPENADADLLGYPVQSVAGSATMTDLEHIMFSEVVATARSSDGHELTMEVRELKLRIAPNGTVSTEHIEGDFSTSTTTIPLLDVTGEGIAVDGVLRLDLTFQMGFPTLPLLAGSLVFEGAF